MIILDTNVISNAIAVRPNERVLAWLAAQDADELWTTSITAAELRAGAAILPEGRRKRDLQDAIEAMLQIDFGNRVLPFDEAASVAYASISAERRRAGMSWDHMDLLIAAIAMINDAAVATRNTTDLDHTSVQYINPWGT